MERRLNVVAAPTKALPDLSGGVGLELTLGKLALPCIPAPCWRRWDPTH